MELTQNDPKQYIQKLKQRDEILSYGWVQIVRTLLIQTSGRKQSMNCADTEGIFRIIQSIPSKKAEPSPISPFQTLSHKVSRNHD